MHNLNRILTCLLLMAALVPPATFALVTLDEKNEVAEELQDAIGDAVASYQQRSGVQGQKGKGERMLLEQKTKIASLNGRKRELRLKIAAQKAILSFIQTRYGVELESKEQVATMVAAEKSRMKTLLRARYLRTVAANDAQVAIMDAVLRAAAVKQNEYIIGDLHERFLKDLVAAEKAFTRLEVYEQDRAAVLNEYWAAEDAYKKAESLIANSEAKLEQIKQITEEVHAQVLRMQGELARIDARLKEKSERELLEKGLIDPRTVGQGAAVRPLFSWPVYGRVSAGFLNESYKDHFGVPHYGLDIVVAQDTPVNAAADGIVFLVRDGGKTGYSYILVGHRGGYATLYGHVSSALVSAGQDVKAGEPIALSGGTPGTHGAGPMTTGAHLHFELIKAGTNIDPKTILP